MNKGEGYVGASRQSLLRGTVILSAAILISKLLGLIYIIPLKHMIGPEGIALLNRGYIPYTIMLSLATLGLPLAVSKYVAQYNSIGDFRRGKRLLRSSFYAMLAMGIVSYLLIYLAAPYLVSFLHQPQALWPIRAVSSALIIVPAMAVMRGYFQGWQSMGPTGLSQVLEQFIRVIFILVSAYLLISWGYSLETTVAVASLGALLGAGAALSVLLVYWFKRRRLIHQQVLSSPYDDSASSTQSLYGELIRYAVPISLLSLAVPFFQLIEWLFYHPVLLGLGYGIEQVEIWFAMLTGLAHKLMMIPVSLASAFSLAIIPALSRFILMKQEVELGQKVDQLLVGLAAFIIPAGVGLFVLAKPLYYTIYLDFQGVVMLQWYAPVAILLAVYIVTSSILQAIQQLKQSIGWLALAVLLKGLLTPLCTWILLENGPILATSLALLAGVLGNMWTISSKTMWPIRHTVNEALKIAMAAAVMGILVAGLIWIMQSYFLNRTWLFYLMQLLGGTTVGLLIYLICSWKCLWLQQVKPSILKKIKNHVSN